METNYWDERAKISYQYKKETFYTITPIPYYYCRRAKIYSLLTQWIKKIETENNSNNISVCDYGCGDGQYILHLLGGKR